MNARTVRKLLLKGLVTNFWGRRAYFTVRVPLEVLPKLPQDPYKIYGDSGPIGGSYVRYEGKGADRRVVITIIQQVSGGGPPKDALFVTPGFGDGWFNWYRAVEFGLRPDEYDTFIREDRGDWPEKLFEVKLSEADIEPHVAWHRWFRELKFPPALERLANAVRYVKTTYPAVVGEYYYITYSLKPYYKDDVRAFCRTMSNAFHDARKKGIVLRVIKP